MITNLISTALSFYTTLIIIYIFSTWVPLSGTLADIQRVLASITEPYLSIFRRIIPTVGNFDFSPIIAIIVLDIIARLLRYVVL